MSLARRFVPVLALFLLGASAQTTPPRTPATHPTTLVSATSGDLPVLLTAPHGGRLRVPGVETRTGAGVPAKRGAKTNFSLAFDRNSDLVALALADEIEARTGKRPYLVVAGFSRRYADANRPPAEAYESPLARPVYDEYHGAVAAYRTEILARFGRGILIDLHGHGGDPVALIRGTADWQTVRNLVETFGKDAVTGPGGLLGPLAGLEGLKLVPLNDDNDARENPSLNGGYTVRHYGSFAGGNFDAIQFELGNALRAYDRFDLTARRLADGVVPFISRYLSGDAPPNSAPATVPSSVPPVR